MLGWVDFRFFLKRRSFPAGRSIAWQIDIYLSALASVFETRARPFAVLLSTAKACSLGCGPRCVLCKSASKLLVFFSEKNDEDTILADFLKKLATAWDGCTAAQQLSCRADWALLVQLCSQLIAVGKG